MKHILLLITTCILLGCTSNSQNDKLFFLQGAWTLQQAEYPTGGIDTYTENDRTLLRLYNGDSVMYQCWLTRTESGLVVMPSMKIPVRLIDKGIGEHIYLEEDNPRPLTVTDDSTIVIQQNGVLYTFHNNNDIANEWGEEIKGIIETELQKDPSTAPGLRRLASQGEQTSQSYVLSAKERRQANVIYGFIFSTIIGIIILLLIIRIALDNRKAKRRLQLQLQQIQEVQDERPQSVKQAMESVATAYFASDEYQALQRRIATGQRLKEDDWQSIEARIRKVYPGFSSQLRNLHTMSELEYQVCLLIKLRIAPKDIATILARDISTISTTRSRLYKKVFGQKGGAKEWDEFILSIGA